MPSKITFTGRAFGVRVPPNVRPSIEHWLPGPPTLPSSSGATWTGFMMDNREYPPNATEDAGGQQDWYSPTPIERHGDVLISRRGHEAVVSEVRYPDRNSQCGAPKVIGRDVDAAGEAADRYGPGWAWQELATQGAEARPVAAADLYRPQLENDLQRPNTRLYRALLRRWQRWPSCMKETVAVLISRRTSPRFGKARAGAPRC